MVTTAPSSGYNSLSFVLVNLTCESLCEYFSKAYEHFKAKVEFALISRRSIKLEINFEGTFVDSRFDRQVEHCINHITNAIWLHSRKDIEECYNSCMSEVYSEIANNLPTGVEAHSYEMTVFVSDFDEDLD